MGWTCALFRALCKTQHASSEPAFSFDGIGDFRDRNLGCRACKPEPATITPFCVYDTCFGQRMQNLGEVRTRDFDRSNDVFEENPSLCGVVQATQCENCVPGGS